MSNIDEAVKAVRENPAYKDWSDEAIRGAIMRAQAEQNNADSPMHPQMRGVYEQISNQVAKVRDFFTGQAKEAIGGKFVDPEQWMKIPGMTRERAEQLAKQAEASAGQGARTVVPQTPVDLALTAAAGPVGRGLHTAGRPVVSGLKRVGAMAGIGAATGAATGDDMATGAATGAAQGAVAGGLGELFNWFFTPKLNPQEVAGAFVRTAPSLQPLRQRYADADQFIDRVIVDGPKLASAKLSALDGQIVRFYGGPDKVIHSRVAAKLEQAGAQGPTTFIPPGQGGYNVSQAGTPLAQVASQNPQTGNIVNDALVDYSVRKISGDNTYKMISVTDALAQVKTLKTAPDRESRALGEALEAEILSQVPAKLKTAYNAALADYRKTMNVIRIASEWRQDLSATHETWGKAVHKLIFGRPDTRGNPDPVFHPDEVAPIIEVITGGTSRTAVGTPAASGTHLYGRLIGHAGPHVGAPMPIGAREARPFRLGDRPGAARIRSMSEIAGTGSERAAREALGDFMTE